MVFTDIEITQDKTTCTYTLNNINNEDLNKDLTDVVLIYSETQTKTIMKGLGVN